MGTGFVELRADGLIHDAAIRNDWLKPAPAQPLSLNLTIGGRPTALIGSTVARQPSSVEPTRFLGHFPFAELEYPPVSGVSVSLRAFGPFVPGDADLSNTPAALFAVHLVNHSAARASIDLDLRCENDLGEPGGRSHTLITEGGIQGVLLKSSDLKGSLAIAVAAQGWAAKASIAETPSVRLSGALAPGEEKTVRLAFAWYFPEWRSVVATTIANRYSGRFADAAGAARFALERAGEIERKIIRWQEIVYARPIPPWLKDALVNSLSGLVRNTVWTADGPPLFLASSQARILEPIHTRLLASIPMLLLFPEQEKAALRAFAKAQTPEGEAPDGFEATALSLPVFGRYRSLASSIFAILCWRDYCATGDREILTGLFLRVRRALQFAGTLDRAGNGLINEPASGTALHAGWYWYGTSAYTAGIGLAALRAGEELAKAAGDSDFASWCRNRFERGRAAFADDLWTGDYYRAFTDPDNFRQSESCYVDQLAGQTAAWLCGLGEIHAPQDSVSALLAVSRLNGRISAIGPVLSAGADGKPDESAGAAGRDIAPAAVWSFCTAALYAAALRDNVDLRESARAAAATTASAVFTNGALWDPHGNISSKDGSPLAQPHDYGALSIWALAFAWEGRSLERAAVTNLPKDR